MSPDDVLPQAATNIPRTEQASNYIELLPFPDLSEAQAQTIFGHASLRTLERSKLCFEEGDAAQNFYLLLEGVLRFVRATPEGEQVTLMHITPGQLFGITKAYESDSHQVSARVVAPGVALSWPSDLWEDFMQDYPGFSQASRKAVGDRAEELRVKIVEMATLHVEQRIAHALIRLAKQAGKQTDDGLEIGFPVTRQDISDMTGTTLHSVSRYMSKWQKSGIVESSRRGILLRHPEQLPM